MKWVLFGIASILGVPLMTAAATWRPARRWLLAGLIASTVVKISVNFQSMELYRGADRGFEVHLTDLIMLALGAGMVLTDARRIRWIPFNFPLLLAFFFSICVSFSVASDALLAGFTLFKFSKGFLLYWVVYNAFRLDPTIEPAWWGAVAAAGVLTVTIVQQKYLHGVYRACGTFDHSNTVPAYSLLLIPLLLNWLLHAERQTLWKSLAAMGAVMGLCFCVVASLSRAGAALMGGAVVVTLAYALVRRRPNTQRIVVASVLGLCMGAGILKSSDTLIARFLNAPKSSGEARDEFNIAARMMARENVFGVGLNCFSDVLTKTDRYRNHIEVMRNEKQAGVCHHIYWLTAAETGWIGLAFFSLVVIRFWTKLLPTAVAGVEEVNTTVLGLGTGIACVHVIGMFEWVLRITPVFNLFVIATGMSIALVECRAGAANRRWSWRRLAIRGRAKGRRRSASIPPNWEAAP